MTFRLKAVVALAALLLTIRTSSGAEMTAKEIYTQRAPSVVTVTVVESAGEGFKNRTKALLDPFPIYKIPFNVISFVLYPVHLITKGPLKAGGSGVIIDSEHFLTNQHVAEFGDIHWAYLQDGRLVRARVVGMDQLEDVALMKMELGKEDKIFPAPIGNARALKPGDRAVAIGSPLRFTLSMSEGIVAAMDRRIVGDFQDHIQTDLLIAPGSSGGPLFNGAGELVGLTSAGIGGPFQSTMNMSFSVPMDVINDILPQLQEKGEVTRGYFGAFVADLTPRTAQQLKLTGEFGKGAVLKEVDSGILWWKAPASIAGLKKGDIIIKYGDTKIDYARTLARAILNTKPGTKVPVIYLRGGKEATATVEIDEL